MVKRMNRIYLGYILVLTCCSAAADTWKLVWSDEFDRFGLPDPARWNYETGFVRNREAQYYTYWPENAHEESGLLIIEARKEKLKNPAFDPGKTGPEAWKYTRQFADYTSASLTTKGRASWKYGRIEVRAQLPSGRGVWPAIWMVGTNDDSVGWPDCGEIDIMEMFGHRPGIIFAHVHTPGTERPSRVEHGGAIRVPDASNAFHEYAVEWNADRLDFFVDNQKYYSYERTDSAGWPFDKDLYLILNLAIGGTGGGIKGIDDAIFPARFCIDYVRVYQREL